VRPKPLLEEFPIWYLHQSVEEDLNLSLGQVVIAKASCAWDIELNQTNPFQSQAATQENLQTIEKLILKDISLEVN
jgi:hypothetical protein